jgi:hypothetical protein
LQSWLSPRPSSFFCLTIEIAASETDDQPSSDQELSPMVERWIWTCHLG